MQKISPFHLFILEIHSNLVRRPDWPHPFLTIPNQKNFNQVLIFMNLYQHAKDMTVSPICSGEIFDLKFLQSDWLRASSFTSRESLQNQRWYRKICLFYMIFKENRPVYFFNLITTKNSNYQKYR